MTRPGELFANPSLPLVIDLGCGYGVSMLGVCYQQERTANSDKRNFLGVDMKTKAIKYARGISKRWGINSHCAFVEASALTALRWAREHYPGPVRWVMCQFPSPFALQCGNSGNGQLPDLSTFIISPEVLEEAEGLLASGGDDGSRGLLLQSQVEDVMVAMKRLVDTTTKLKVASDPAFVQWNTKSDQNELLSPPTDRWVSETLLHERSRAQLARGLETEP